jgi:hypothetical protein
MLVFARPNSLAEYRKHQLTEMVNHPFENGGPNPSRAHWAPDRARNASGWTVS